MAIDKQTIIGTNKTLYTNISCDQIQIAEDKLRLKLEKHLTVARKSNNWLTYFSIAISIIVTLGTAQSFNPIGPFNSEEVKIGYYCLLIIVVLIMIYNIYNALRYKTSVNEIIKDLKENE
jgi:polyferredoxin